MSQPIDLAAHRLLYGQSFAERLRVLNEAASAACKMAGNLDAHRPDPAALEDLARQADALRVAALRAAAAARANTPGAA